MREIERGFFLFLNVQKTHAQVPCLFKNTKDVFGEYKNNKIIMVSTKNTAKVIVSTKKKLKRPWIVKRNIRIP